MKHVSVTAAALLLLAFCAGAAAAADGEAAGSRVEVIERADGTFTLSRNGKPYLVKGAGTGSGEALGGGDLQLLATSGGNSIRTWGVEQLEDLVDGKSLLDRAHELGITVTAGFWVKHKRHGFDYSNADSIQKQRALLREAVLKYKDHPALLTWGLGNEMEAFGSGPIDVRIWQELNHLAGIIKELDSDHPVMTVVADVDADAVEGILRYYPNLDILGVNSYGSASSVGKRLVEAGWRGPYMLGEFGVEGTWEVATTSWDAPIEPDPSTKAAQYYTTYTMDRDDNVGRSLGSYAFFWGHKQEATATWFGMFLPTGEKLPTVDAMAYAWSGKWPDNRAPKLQSLESPVAFEKVAPGSTSRAVADIVDREGDELRFVWDIRAESTDRRVGGDAEAAPLSFPEAIKDGQGTPEITFRTPSQPGGYRIFVTAYDDQGGAVAHNLPFYVGE